jgi:hypothetical protein
VLVERHRKDRTHLTHASTTISSIKKRDVGSEQVITGHAALVKKDRWVCGAKEALGVLLGCAGWLGRANQRVGALSWPAPKEKEAL